MSSEFKLSVAYRDYMLNILCKSGSSLAEVSLVGILIGDDYDILNEAGNVLHVIDFGKPVGSPRDAQIAFSHFVADGGGATLDSKIAGEPEEVVEAEPVQAPAKKKTASKKKA